MTTETDKLTCDRKNANKGTDRGRALVESSISECGAGRSILADSDGIIIAGNKTYEAAQRLGIPIRVVETENRELVVVKRTDLRLDADERARRLAYPDNRAGEVGLEWDLAQILANLESGLGFSGCGLEERELAAPLARLEASGGLTDPDSVLDLPEQPVTKQGYLLILGHHRLYLNVGLAA